VKDTPQSGGLGHRPVFGQPDLFAPGPGFRDHRGFDGSPGGLFCCFECMEPGNPSNRGVSFSVSFAFWPGFESRPIVHCPMSVGDRPGFNGCPDFGNIRKIHKPDKVESRKESLRLPRAVLPVGTGKVEVSGISGLLSLALLPKDGISEILPSLGGSLCTFRGMGFSFLRLTGSSSGIFPPLLWLFGRLQCLTFRPGPL